ncbi:MAG: hypothetical protein EGQ88_00810 [Prevotellamassilia timonensis]|nr:hypothetical protein [Prevotellamassilia timonensis]
MPCQKVAFISPRCTKRTLSRHNGGTSAGKAASSGNQTASPAAAHTAGSVPHSAASLRAMPEG